MSGSSVRVLIALLATVVCSFVFSLVQYYEYGVVSFTISDSVYGAVFFWLTGLHGLHVLVGSVYLVSFFVRLS